MEIIKHRKEYFARLTPAVSHPSYYFGDKGLCEFLVYDRDHMESQHWLDRMYGVGKVCLGKGFV